MIVQHVAPEGWTPTLKDGASYGSTAAAESANMGVAAGVTVWCDLERTKSTKVWLLTDHVGEKDASSRIVFDPKAKLFGLEMTLDDGTEWYLGPQSESFAATVRSM